MNPIKRTDNKYRDSVMMMYNNVDMPGGWKFNHIKTLKQIDLFTNSKYATGEIDDQGFYKFFRDISTAPCDIASKFIDIDVQNFRFLPRPSMQADVTDNELAVYHFNKDFKIYADENKLGALINQHGDDLPKYGSIFTKNVRGQARRVAPHNMKFDPSAPNLRASSFVAEPYLMRKAEILAMRDKWNKIKNFEDVLSRGETDLYLIYEFYENYGTEWKRSIVADVFAWKDNKGGIIRSLESNVNYQGEMLPSVTLHEDTMKELPYYDHKWKNVDGRLLGYGYVEYLFPNQISTNEVENIERKNLYFTSLVLLQTRDHAVGGKNLASAQSGDFLDLDSEVTKVPMEERNLAAYNSANSRWDQSTAMKTFSFDIASGNNLPSRTPLGVANLQAGMVTSFYEKKRENFGMHLKDDILKHIIIPSFKDKTAREHLLTIGSDEKDLEEYIKFVAKVYVDKAVADYAEKHGFYPSIEQRKTIEQQTVNELRSRKNQNIKIPDFHYDNIGYKLEVDITGESVDTGVKSALIDKGLSIVGSNPAILQNKTALTMFTRFLALGGITPQELGIDMNNIDMTPMQPAGSVAAPSQPTAAPGNVTSTLR